MVWSVYRLIPVVSSLPQRCCAPRSIILLDIKTPDLHDEYINKLHLSILTISRCLLSTPLNSAFKVLLGVRLAIHSECRYICDFRGYVLLAVFLAICR